MLSLGNLEEKMKKNLLTYLPLLQLCFVPESFQPPSSDALLPQKKGREIDLLFLFSECHVSY